MFTNVYVYVVIIGCYWPHFHGFSDWQEMQSGMLKGDFA